MIQDKYGQLCNRLFTSNHAIAAVAIIVSSKEVVYKTSEIFPIPEEKDRLMHMLKQAYILVNEPVANEDYFGKVRYVMVHHDAFDVFLFRMSSDPLKILAVAAVADKYVHRELVEDVSKGLID